jgi:hypothetical protein
MSVCEFVDIGTGTAVLFLMSRTVKQHDILKVRDALVNAFQCLICSRVLMYLNCPSRYTQHHYNHSINELGLQPIQRRLQRALITWAASAVSAPRLNFGTVQ